MDREMWLAVGAVVLAMVLGLSMIVYAAYSIQGRQCEARARMMGFPHDYGWLTGCMIEHQPGRWIPSERYRVID
jgi:hypothetical protein